MLEVRNVSRHFKLSNNRGTLHAVDDVSLQVAVGETVGLVGESGCGKSTIARLIARTLDITSGAIVFSGQDIGLVPCAKMSGHASRGDIQMVFQDALGSLNPSVRVSDSIAEPLKRLRPSTDITALVNRAADAVGLPQALLTRYPHQLSGGQLARVGIARAIVLEPKLLVLDEPTAALDVSVQAVVLQTLARLRKDLKLAMIFVSHDLNIVRLLCDRVIVMYLGKIMEQGPAAQVFAQPQHPYTKALIASIPSAQRRNNPLDTSQFIIDVEPQSPINPNPDRCRFVGRCPVSTNACSTVGPVLTSVAANDHRAACIHLEEHIHAH